MGRAPSLVASLYILLVLVAAGSASGQAEPAEGKKAKKKAVAEGAEVLVWDGTPLTEIKVVQRLLRLNKSGQWTPERLPKLARMAVETDRRLLKQLGHFYLALTAARDNSPPQALEHLKSAVSFGFSNVVAIIDASEFSDLRDNPEFKALIEELTKTVEKEARERFTSRTDASFAASKEAAGAPWLPDLKTASGQPFWHGRPTLVVVTRVHHEGFEKLLGRLKEIPGEKTKGAGLSVLFYQDDAGNERRAAQAREYAEKVGKKLGTELPYAVIGRKDYKELDARMLAVHEKVAAAIAPAGGAGDDGSEDPSAGPLNVFPLIVGFFGNQGEFHHAICGVPEIWQLEYALGKLLEAGPSDPDEPRKEPEPTAQPQPKPEEAAPPAEPEPPKAETPAEKPAADSETPPPENGSGAEEKKAEGSPEKAESERR